MVKGLHFISLGLSLSMCLSLGIVHALGLVGMQPDHKSRYSVPTIISAMSSDLSSTHGNCSFPPNEVLTNVNSYDFLEMCDRKMPSLDKLVTDADAIMCLGLLEVGLHLCSLGGRYFENDQLFSLPSDAHSFNSLVLNLKRQDNLDLCTNLKKVLDILAGMNIPEDSLKQWTLQKVFDEGEGSCSRICFDYKNKPQLLCKLILWGSNVMVQQEPKRFQLIISNSTNGNEAMSKNSLLGIGLGESRTDKSGPVISSNQDGYDEQGSQAGAHISRNNVKSSITSVGTGTDVASSPVDEPVGQAMSVMKSAVNKSEILNKSDSKQNNVKLPTNRQNETPSASSVASAEVLKNMDSVSGSSTAEPSIEQVIINEDPQKTITKPDAASIDSTKAKDINIGLDEKSEINQGEKAPTDMGLRDYESSLDDDDVNFPPIEQEQPVVNHEATGYKTDYKNSQDEFTNANTFLQERFENAEDSHFFSYFMAMVVLCIVGYVLFHNKQKILALALEGRSRRTSRRRPATANYHKLDNNLEEAVSSPCNTSVTHVIY